MFSFKKKLPKIKGKVKTVRFDIENSRKIEFEQQLDLEFIHNKLDQLSSEFEEMSVFESTIKKKSLNEKIDAKRQARLNRASFDSKKELQRRCELKVKNLY